MKQNQQRRPGANRTAQKIAGWQQVDSSRQRFVPAHSYTVSQVDQALATANAAQLGQALDPDVRATSVTFRCPVCREKAAYALGLHHWQCDRCQQLGSWVALRHLVALSVESCVRLCRVLYGPEQVGR